MTKDKAIRSMRQIAREGQNWLKNPTKPFIQDLRFGTGTTCYAGSIDPQSANEDLSRIDRILVFFHGNNKSDLALHIDRKVEIIKSCIQSVCRLVV